MNVMVTREIKKEQTNRRQEQWLDKIINNSDDSDFKEESR